MSDRLGEMVPPIGESKEVVPVNPTPGRSTRWIPPFLRRHSTKAPDIRPAALSSPHQDEIASEKVSRDGHEDSKVETSGPNSPALPPDREMLPAAEGDGINADILVGLNNLLDEIPDSIKRGRIPSGYLGSEFRRGLELLQKSPGSPEMTEESKNALGERMRSQVAEHLETGLKSIVSSTETWVGLGIVSDIKQGHERISQFYAFADELQVPLGFSSDDDIPEGSNRDVPAVRLDNEAGMHAHLDRRIDAKLPEGLGAKIKAIGSDVSSGYLSNVPGHQAKVDEIMQIMQERGFAIVDKEPTPPQEGHDQAGLLPREINRQEVQRLIDEQIKTALAAGVARLLDRAKSDLQQGFGNPLDRLSPETIAHYSSEGEKHGVVNRSLTSVTEGNEFNPDLIEPQIASIVRDHVAGGFEAMRDRHRKHIENGDMFLIDVPPRVMEEYFELAEKFGVSIDQEAIRTGMAAQATPESLQKGTQTMVEVMRKKLKDGNFSSAQSSVGDIGKMQEFIQRHELSDQVDLQPLIMAYADAGIELPQLA